MVAHKPIKKQRSSTYEKKLFFNGTFDELLDLAIGKELKKDSEKESQQEVKSSVAKSK
mgnify:CR=1 FL=1